MIEDAVPLDSLRRALVIKLRHHGDVLLASPVLTVLKNHAPQCEIDALVYADTAPMLALHPALAQLHTIDRKWKQLGPIAQARAEWTLLATLRARKYDLVVHLTDHPRGAWLTRLCGARWAVAPKIAGARKWWRKSFTHFYANVSHSGRHVVERQLDALRRIGIQPQEHETKLVLTPGDDAHRKIDSILDQAGLTGVPFVHLHPASRWFFKCWPAERYVELIDYLDARGWRTVVTAAPDEQEAALVGNILSRTRHRPIDLSGQLSLKELAALTNRAALFVGVDSAPMHIAAAAQVPVVALFGPTSETDWGPWGTVSRVVVSEAHLCRPCGLDGCGGGKVSDCLVKLPVERVKQAIDELMGSNEAGAR